MGADLRQRLGAVVVLGALAGLAGLGSAAWRDYRRRYPPQDLGQTCCVPGARPRRAPSSEIPSAFHLGDPAAGAALYTSVCAGCHLEDGSGRPGDPHHPPLRDLRALRLAPSEVGRIIVRGEGAMPAFGGLLGAQEVLDLVAHVRRLSDADPPR